MSRRKKVVLVANDVGGVGGMEKHLEEMIQRMKKDYDVTVVSSSFRIPDKHGIRFVRIPTIRRPFCLMTLMFTTYASLRVLLLSRDAIVHTTGAILLTKADVCTVHFCHAGWKEEVGGMHAHRSVLHKINHDIGMKIKLWMERHCYTPERTGRLVPVSRRVQQELLKFYPYSEPSVNVISNGVDTNDFYPARKTERRTLRDQFGLPRNGTYVIFMGGDWERKGLRYVLDAFNKLANLYPELHVLVVGPGDTTRFSQHVHEPHVSRVHFVGKQPNPQLWFRLSDVFVFPSNYEACSLAVLEAAASGLALVVTNVGGANDIVEDGQTGYFVERSSHSIQLKLQYLLDRPHEAKRIGLNARKRVESLTWDNTYQHFSRLYSAISESERFIEPEVPMTERI